MINEHDVTKKMLNVIREALEPIDNQNPVKQQEAEEPVNQEQPIGGPVDNIMISGILPSGIEFTMNYKENLGVVIFSSERIKLEKDIVEDLSQLLGIQKQFSDRWNERGANTNLGKKQQIIYRTVSENGTITKQEFGPNESKNWFNDDMTLFNPVSNQITFTSYIINP